MHSIANFIGRNRSGLITVVLLATASLRVFGQCTGYQGRTLSLEDLEGLAKRAGFACRNLAEVIALLSVESEERNGRFHADLKCSNGDASLDIGLWQINNYPWRADGPFDKCNGITCTTKSSGPCCAMHSQAIEDMALDTQRATDYAWSVWKNSQFSFRRWSGYGTAAFWARYPSALSYIETKYPNCAPRCSLINGTLVCPPEPVGPISAAPVEIVTSNDPNDKVGTRGTTVERYINKSEPLRYAIYFENKPNATASAQDVVITDKLDGSSLDLNTLALGPITFVDRIVTPTPGPIGHTGPFSIDVDLRPGQNLIVKISALLNPTAGILTWTFRSLDPATMQPPDDPLAGFLPIGGQGSVAFSVQPKATLSTGTTITNKATIVFDTNPPLDTPLWLNTLDKTSPASTVLALPPKQTTSTFPVRWNGSDVGVGVASYDVYVSENSSPFTAWHTGTTSTQATFAGVNGRTYSFYSIAQDLVGNVESTKTTAEAVTTVSESSCAANVSGQFALTRSGFRFNNAAQRFVQTAALRNIGSTAVAGPLSLVLDGLTASAVLFNRSGLTSCSSPIGSAYVDAVNSAGVSILPGQTVTLTLEFTNPTNQPINYTTRILAGTGSR